MLLIDIEMPKSCSECFCCRFVQFKEQDYYSCNIRQITFGVEDKDWLYEQRPNWCPLIELNNVGECYKH